MIFSPDIVGDLANDSLVSHQLCEPIEMNPFLVETSADKSQTTR
jgi:hypothetical protein